MPVFRKIFARDPANPNDIASNATITLFDPADPNKTPVALTKLDGTALANPYTVNRQGEGPAFQHESLYIVGWEGGGHSGEFDSIESMHADTLAARTAAENSVLLAQDAQAAATNAGATAAAEAAAAAEAEIAALVASGEFKGDKGDTGLPGPDAIPADEAVAAYATTPGTATAAALSSTIATREYSSYPAYPFMAKLLTGGQDVAMLNLSDSTGSATDGYFSQTLDWLGQQFPAYGIEYIDWNHVTNVFDAPVVRKASTNGFTIRAYNGGREGMHWEYHVPFLRQKVGAIQPDLILINHGHNIGSFNTSIEAHMARLVGSIQMFAPSALIVLCSQNPRMDGMVTTEVSQNRANIVRDMARLMGCGFVDWYRAFIDSGNVAGLTRTDNLHPNDAGQVFMADVLKEFLRWRPYGQPLPALTPMFHTGGRNLLPNGNFAKWTTSPGAPDNFTANNVTIVKDTTRFESANGYAAKLTLSGTAAGTIVGQVKKENVQGKWITAAARFYVPAGSHANAGKLQLSSSMSLGSSTLSTVGGWKWEVISRYYPIDFGFDVNVTAYGATTSTATGDVWIDRLFVCEGLLPHDG